MTSLLSALAPCTGVVPLRGTPEGAAASPPGEWRRGRLLTSGFLQCQSWRVAQRADCWESVSEEERAGSQGNAGSPELERAAGWVEEQASVGQV